MTAPIDASRVAVFIAGPYAVEPFGSSVLDELHIRFNIARATALGQLAVAMGLAPIIPHVLGSAVLGMQETPDVRKKALSCAVAWADIVAKQGGLCWLLQRDDGTVSDGCVGEKAVFRASHCGIREGTWEDWRLAFRSVGLAATWQDHETFNAWRMANRETARALWKRFCVLDTADVLTDKTPKAP